MFYRVNDLPENKINPITGHEYDNSWIVLILTDSNDYQQMCGNSNGCVYTIKISRTQYEDWRMAIGDFIGFCNVTDKNAILVLSEADLADALRHYEGHRYNESFLRENEPSVFVHSTTMHNWKLIQRDRMLKSWNKLKSENAVCEDTPIGLQLGDPIDFSDYIMFGGGTTGEIVVNSKQQGKIIMDENAEYNTGARLYFDAKRIAQDGLLIRDGCHLKVKDTLPLEPYLIWTATWDTVGLPSRISTPKIFAEQADQKFQSRTYGNKNSSDSYLCKDGDGNIFISIENTDENLLSENPLLTHCLAVVKIGNDYLLGWNKWRSRYEIFGGCIESGETVRQCIIRECYEELGIQNEEPRYLGAMKFLLMPDYFSPNERVEYGGLYGIALPDIDISKIYDRIKDREEIGKLAFYSQIKDTEPIAPIDEKLLEFF